MVPPEAFSLEQELELIARGTEEIFPENELVKKLEKSRAERRPLRVKLGVDPTSTDLHLGHIIPILKMKQFQDLGHHCILIIGDYTATVGDPSGRNKTRPHLTHTEVLANAATYQDQVFKILDPQRTEIVYNGHWFSKMSFQDIIRLMSSMTVARMLEREDFAVRYGSQQPISLHEFIYPLMQGFDSVEIRADIELGGIDQKFNILVGRDLQRDAGLEPQVGICNPLLIGTDGKEKMGKSLGNYIGLTESPENMYGKVMSIPDDIMLTYYELMTTVSLKEIKQLESDLKTEAIHPRDAKRRLAREVVKRFHDAPSSLRAEREFDRVFVEGERPEDMQDITIEQSALKDGKIWIVKLLVDADFAQSNAEARRLIQQGGVRINDEPVASANLDWEPKADAVIQVGKRKFGKIKFV